MQIIPQFCKTEKRERLLWRSCYNVGSESVGLGLGLRFCISNLSLGHDNAGGLGAYQVASLSGSPFLT